MLSSKIPRVVATTNISHRCMPTIFSSFHSSYFSKGEAIIQVAGGARRTKTDDTGTKKCPFTQWDGLVNGKRPIMTEVRSLPIIGSLPTPRLTGVPPINILTNAYDFWVAMRNKFGEFYSYGSLISGNPNDLYRTSHVINDPTEYVKIIRAGGKYPSGLLQSLWFNIRWGETRDMKAFVSVHGKGEEWRRLRTSCTLMPRGDMSLV